MFSDALEKIFDDLQTEHFTILCRDTETRKNVLLALQDNGVDIHASMDRRHYIDDNCSHYGLEFMNPVVSKKAKLGVYGNPPTRASISGEEFLVLIKENEELDGDFEIPDIQSLFSIL